MDLFGMTDSLFGLEILEVLRGSVPIWHKDVQFYEIKEEGKPHC
jgi:Zn-dependent oligopeptidase